MRCASSNQNFIIQAPTDILNSSFSGYWESLEFFESCILSSYFLEGKSSCGPLSLTQCSVVRRVAFSPKGAVLSKGGSELGE